MKLSIITINYNNAKGLKRTMESVISQQFFDYEYLIIDGRSDDGSVDVIKELKDKVTYWVSEPDSGIYDAMNKGIEAAKGEYLFFLNSGDCFIDSAVLGRLKVDFTEDLVYGNLLIKESDKSWVKKYPSSLSFDYFTKDTIPHSGGTFIKRQLFEEVGLFTTNYDIIADWEFYMKSLFRYNARSRYIDETIGTFEFNGLSSRPENRELIQTELDHLLNVQFNYLSQLNQQLNDVSRKYRLLSGSRVVQAYMKIKNRFSFLL